MKLEKDALFHDRYRLVELLGKGGFSEVWLAEDTRADNMQIAIKIYASGSGLDESGTELFRKEFALVFNLNHTNLLRPVHYDLCGRMPYLILPYCEKGSAERLIGSATEDDVWKVLHNVAAGLAYLHEQKPDEIIHQDVKPGNILINTQGDFMLTDFGISTKIRNTLRKSMSSQVFTSGGTLAYMGPERFSANNQPVMASDIWALGATVYELMTGDTPFGNHGGLLQQNGAATPNAGGNWSTVLRQVITLCLSKETWDRPTASTLVQWASLHFNHARQEQEKAVTAYMMKKKPDRDSKKKYKFYIAGGAAAAGIIVALFVWFSFMKPDTPKQDDTLKSEPVENNTVVIPVNNEPEKEAVAVEPSEYDKMMENADKSFDKKEYVLSRTLYNKAYELAGNDAERSKAKDRIDECNKLITPVAVPEPTVNEYRTHLQNGERLFNAGKYREAYSEFDKASREDATYAEKQAARERGDECNSRMETQAKDALRKAKELSGLGGADNLDKAFIYYKQAKDLGSNDRSGYNTYKEKAEGLIKVFGAEEARSNKDVINCLQHARQLNNTREIRALMESLGLNN